MDHSALLDQLAKMEARISELERLLQFKADKPGIIVGNQPKLGLRGDVPHASRLFFDQGSGA